MRYNVPTLVDGGVCGSVDSATSYKRVLVAGRIIKNKIIYKNKMNNYEITFEDEIRIKKYIKKNSLFRFISRFFCMHFWKRNGIYGKVDIWTCCKCGKNYYQDNPFNSGPISYINN